MAYRSLLALGVLLCATASLPAQSRTADSLDLEMGVKVPLRDGVKLNATLYFPQGPRTPRAVVLAMTPYMADRYHAYAIPIAKRGYVVAVVDVRGRGSSEGKFDPFAQEAKDGYDVIEWLARLPYTTGQVGMWGTSFAAHLQAGAVQLRPPALKALVLNMGGMANAWDHGVRFRGTYEMGRQLTWAWNQSTSPSSDITASASSSRSPRKAFAILPATSPASLARPQPRYSSPRSKADAACGEARSTNTSTARAVSSTLDGVPAAPPQPPSGFWTPSRYSIPRLASTSAARFRSRYAASTRAVP